MIELSILKMFCTSKDVYLKYNKHVNLAYIKVNFKEIYKLYSTLTFIYSKFPNISISREDLESVYMSNYPVLKDADRRELSLLLDRVFSTTVSETLLTEVLESHRVRAAAGEIAIAALGASEGKKGGLEALQKAVAALADTTEGVDSQEFVTDDLDAIFHETIDTPGIHFPIPCLNRAIGPLRKGNFGVVFARPEAGKSTFLAQFATHAVQHVDRPILWFNNEQAGNEVKIRLYQAAFGVTVKELLQDRLGFQAKYKELTKGLLLLVDSDIIYRETIESLCRQYDPSLVVIDQLDKIAGGKDEDRRDLTLGNTYVWARGLAKRYCPVIGICQASDSGENVKYLTYSHMADSRTAKPAEPDWILGIGSSNSDDFKWFRYFNISKNKLLGDANTDPSLRHGQFQVILVPEVGRYQEL